MPCTLRASDDCIQELCRNTITFVKIGRPPRCRALFSGAPPGGRTRRQHGKRSGHGMVRQHPDRALWRGERHQATPQGIMRNASRPKINCKTSEKRQKNGNETAADVVEHWSTLTAGTANHQRFQLQHIGRAQVFARQQGLHLRKNAVLRHGWQKWRRRANGDTGHADGQPFRCSLQPWPTYRAAPQQTSHHADQ